MTTRQNGELAHEYEDELLGELEAELGSAHEAVHHEDELEAALHEDEFEVHHEDELEAALHEHGFHEHGFHESHHEGEQFFGKLRRIARGVGGFIRRAAPILKSIAKVAVPMVAGAVGGPLGGILGKVATQALGEDEAVHEDEFEVHHEDEFEVHHEDELEAALHENEFELHHELHHEDELAGHHETHHETHHEGLPELAGHHELHHEMHHEAHHEAHHELMAEVMAEVAAGAQHEAEAEAMAGAAVVTVLTARDRAALRRLLPHLVRGAAVLTRILRRRRVTRPAVRTIPTIVRTTVSALRRRAAAGRPVNRRVAGAIMGAVTRRVLSSPRMCGAVIVRNVRRSMRAGGGMRRVRG
jgi:hypothetical protein